MSKHASKIINLSKSWIGRKESDGSHKYIIDLYNSQSKLPRNYKVKYTDSWCATFISALAIKLGYTDIIPVECGCQEMINLFKKIGCWQEDESVKPKEGWILFYDWQDNGQGDNKGWSDHVGIVESVSGDSITVIEGNRSNMVKRVVIKVNAVTIRGYGVPKYDAESKKDLLVVDGEWGRTTTLKTQGVFSTIKDGEISHQHKDCKKYLSNCLTSSWEFDDTEKGSQLIRAIQKYLKEKGYNVGTIDGLCGKQTVKAIQQFLNDRAYNCGEVDGYMGAKTVKAWQKYINNRL